MLGSCRISELCQKLSVLIITVKVVLKIQNQWTNLLLSHTLADLFFRGLIMDNLLHRL
jgi:hypothetical protein